ncbi:MAG TPA: hypothetical protein EYP28_03120 [Methanophagales archaeon]|nr:hypothetical protein [Methanophagales archaeon]
MEIITLKVPDVVSAIGVLETPLKRELILLDKSIVDTKKKLREFAGKNGMRSEDFFLIKSIKGLRKTIRILCCGLLSMRH